MASKPNLNPKVDDHVMNVKARHNLEIGNMSNKYQLNPFYTDPKNPPILFTNINTTNPPISSTNITTTNHTKIVKKTIGPVRPNGTSQNTSWTFNWPIKTMDLTTLTYFWIVLIGVILSKLSTRMTKGGESAESHTGKLSNHDYLWIGIIAIIALLIFSSFQQ